MNDRLQLNSELRQQQTLTPMQVQFVRLLEMNAAAIEDEVQRRLDENPALEVAEPAENSRADDSFNETAEDLQRADYRDEDDMPPLPASARSHGTGDAASVSSILESSAADEETLADMLTRQLREADVPDDATRAYAEFIIGNLDSNGRLTRTLIDIADDISVETGTEVSRTDVVPAFELVRSFDPAGVCAIDLRDCLLLQLRRMDDDNADVALARLVVDRYFDLLASRRYDKLAQRVKASADDLDRALAIIRGLDPYPGSSVSSSADRAQHITPDLVVEPDYDDPTGRRFLVSLSQRVPELTVAQWVTTGEGDRSSTPALDQADAFMRSRGREARDFIELLKRRNDTLLAVMRTIVDMQSEFFRTEDPATIRPMILREVAERIGRDISVVSRATSGKYVSMPGGVYPLKMFFNEAPTDQADVSAHSIQDAIRRLIEGEDKRAPLSDDAITAQLADQGLDIARRTVAKYREQMGFPNSRGRIERRAPKP